MYQGQQEWLRQGIEWMKLKEADFIARYFEAVRAGPPNFFSRMDDATLSKFAQVNIKGIIARLDGVQISLERTETNLFAFFEQGCILSDLQQVLETGSNLINDYVKQQLSDRPLVATALLDKIKYIEQAYATVTSLAMVKFHTRKQA